MNIITAFIDGSAVYGSDDRLTRMLRKFSGGELAENQEIPGFLPWSYEVDPTVPPTQLPEDRTILAGDRRANEMPGLTVLHTCTLKSLFNSFMIKNASRNLYALSAIVF